MTDPPFEGIVGAFVAWLKRRPFVYNIRELYPEMAVAGEIVRPARWVRIWEALTPLDAGACRARDRPR